MAEGPEDLSAVPALRAGGDSSSDSSQGGFRLPGGLRLPALPQLSFGQARR